MSDLKKIIVVGGGLAGAKTVEALRDQGFTGAISLYSAENNLPYERPALSKEYLAGEADFESAVVHPQEWYDEHNVELHLGTPVTGVDSGAKQITTETGEKVAFDKLVLATGSTARTIPLPGIDAEGVFTLRNREDSDALKARFGPGHKVVTIGGGWIGLEAAATARNAGSNVTVLEAGALPLINILGPEIAEVFVNLHQDHGVDIQVNAKVAKIVEENGKAAGVQLEDGTIFEADTVIVGVGAEPNVALAKDAGLDVDNGVLVDSALQTSNPDIYAIGDIANHDHPTLGKRIRVEHLNTALIQPEALAKTIQGTKTDYTELPFFFSDQYDLGLEYVGHAGRDDYDDVVVRGDLEKREFIAFWLSEGRIVAEMNVNVWDIPDIVTPLIAEGKKVDPAQLADESVELSSV